MASAEISNGDGRVFAVMWFKVWSLHTAAAEACRVGPVGSTAQRYKLNLMPARAVRAFPPLFIALLHEPGPPLVRYADSPSRHARYASPHGMRRWTKSCPCRESREQRTYPVHLRLPIVQRWKKERFAYDYNRTIAKPLASPLTSFSRRSEIQNLRDSVGPFGGHGDDR